MGLGHAFEIDKALPDSFVLELAQALWFDSSSKNTRSGGCQRRNTRRATSSFASGRRAVLICSGVMTGQTIELLGMMTEAIHTPLLHDRWAAIKGADYVFTAARSPEKSYVSIPKARWWRRPNRCSMKR